MFLIQGFYLNESLDLTCLLPFQPFSLWHFSLCSLYYVNSLHVFLLFFRVPYCYLNGFYTEHFVITLCLVVISDRMFFLCSNNSHCLSPCSWFFYDFSFWISDLRYLSWASLVAQWLRICLLMQGTRVCALVWEDLTCHGATGPVHHNCWACASGACAPQREGPR